jgi:hypothetical protein
MHTHHTPSTEIVKPLDEILRLYKKSAHTLEELIGKKTLNFVERCCFIIEAYLSLYLLIKTCPLLL